MSYQVSSTRTPTSTLKLEPDDLDEIPPAVLGTAIQPVNRNYKLVQSKHVLPVGGNPIDWLVAHGLEHVDRRNIVFVNPSRNDLGVLVSRNTFTAQSHHWVWDKGAPPDGRQLERPE